MPAPVTTTIFLHLATDKDMSLSVRRICGSALDVLRSRVTVIVPGQNEVSVKTEHNLIVGYYLPFAPNVSETRQSRAQTRLLSA